MMLCDELKPLMCAHEPNVRPMYDKHDVDAAIDELKYIIEKNQSAYYVDLGIVANDCEKLKAENERLTIDKRNEELRADQADAVIAELKEVAEDACLERDDNSRVIDELESENRKLKRALWLARGYIMTLLNRDFQRLAYQCNNDDYKKNLLRRRNRYYELSEKCLKKAKEYK